MTASAVMLRACPGCGSGWRLPDGQWLHFCGPACPPPAICPICKGSGIREKVGIENAPTPYNWGQLPQTPCHGCGGKGWVR